MAVWIEHISMRPDSLNECWTIYAVIIPFHSHWQKGGHETRVNVSAFISNLLSQETTDNRSEFRTTEPLGSAKPCQVDENSFVHIHNVVREQTKGFLKRTQVVISVESVAVCIFVSLVCVLTGEGAPDLMSVVHHQLSNHVFCLLCVELSPLLWPKLSQHCEHVCVHEYVSYFPRRAPHPHNRLLPPSFRKRQLCLTAFFVSWTRPLFLSFPGSLSSSPHYFPVFHFSALSFFSIILCLPPFLLLSPFHL